MRRTLTRKACSLSPRLGIPCLQEDIQEHTRFEGVLLSLQEGLRCVRTGALGGVAPQPVRVRRRTQAWLSMHYLSPGSLLAAEMTEDVRRLMAAAALMPAAAADTLSTEE